MLSDLEFDKLEIVGQVLLERKDEMGLEICEEDSDEVSDVSSLEADVERKTDSDTEDGASDWGTKVDTLDIEVLTLDTT
jgi:hypothetical protein